MYEGIYSFELAESGLQCMTATTTSQKQQFTIELGVARSQEEAATALEKWEKQGMKAYYTPFYDGKKVIYRIRKGVYHSMKAARKEFKNFKKTDSFSPYIVKMWNFLYALLFKPLNYSHINTKALILSHFRL